MLQDQELLHLMDVRRQDEAHLHRAYCRRVMQAKALMHPSSESFE